MPGPCRAVRQSLIEIFHQCCRGFVIDRPERADRGWDACLEGEAGKAIGSVLVPQADWQELSTIRLAPDCFQAIVQELGLSFSSQSWMWEASALPGLNWEWVLMCRVV